MKSLTECAGFWYLGGVFGWGLWFTDTSTLGHFCICWCPENWVEYFETYNLFNVLSSINLPPHPTIKMSFSDIELIFLEWFCVDSLQTKYPLSTLSRNIFFGIFKIIALWKELFPLSLLVCTTDKWPLLINRMYM